MIKEKEVKTVDTNMEDKIIIERVNGGYIITEYKVVDHETNNEIVYREEKSVIEDSVNEIHNELNDFEISEEGKRVVTNEEASMYRLLLEIKNKYGVFYNDHKPVNLAVEIQEQQNSLNERLKKSGIVSLGNRLVYEKDCNLNENLKKIKNFVIELSNQAIGSVEHVARANYQERESEAKDWIYKKEAKVLELIDKLLEE